MGLDFGFAEKGQGEAFLVYEVDEAAFLFLCGVRFEGPGRQIEDGRDGRLEVGEEKGMADVAGGRSHDRLGGLGRLDGDRKLLQSRPLLPPRYFPGI